MFGWLDERGEDIRYRLDSKTETSKTPEKAPVQQLDELDEQSHAFNDDYIKEYRPNSLKSSYYDTICLQACRDDNHKVHLYEMYWADLSRVGKGFIEVFSEFYQILFHLSWTLFVEI